MELAMLKKTTLSVLAALAIAGPVLGGPSTSAQAASYVPFRCDDETRPANFRPDSCEEQLQRRRLIVDVTPNRDTRPDDPQEIFRQLERDGGGGGR
jgi:hypothetical protein